MVVGELLAFYKKIERKNRCTFLEGILGFVAD
jgi:hypothetical protein